MVRDPRYFYFLAWYHARHATTCSTSPRWLVYAPIPQQVYCSPVLPGNMTRPNQGGPEMEALISFRDACVSVQPSADAFDSAAEAHMRNLGCGNEMGAIEMVEIPSVNQLQN